MLLEEIIKPDSVLCNAQARSKKHCLEILSELLVRSVPQIANEEIVARLIERERLGCTSLGQGVAFPHCRVEGLDTNTAALIKLSEPVDFDSADGEPVRPHFRTHGAERNRYRHTSRISAVLPSCCATPNCAARCAPRRRASNCIRP